MEDDDSRPFLEAPGQRMALYLLVATFLAILLAFLFSRVLSLEILARLLEYLRG